MPKDIENALSNGFEDYLTKPMDVVKFLELINKYKTSAS
jgi:response regulator of citrate/malate metabolism